MTDDRSLERAARAWLELGPNRAPEHAVQAALERIEQTSQERHWPLPTGGRWIQRTGRTLGAVAMATLVLAVPFVGAHALTALLDRSAERMDKALESKLAPAIRQRPAILPKPSAPAASVGGRATGVRSPSRTQRRGCRLQPSRSSRPRTP